MQVAVIGHINKAKSSISGQIVKTDNLISELNRYTDYSTTIVNSYGWKKNPIALLHKIKKAFRDCDAVIMLPAQHGVRVFAPILTYYKKRYKKRIYYDVIGGWLPEMLRERSGLKKHLVQYDGIWVETNMMKQLLIKEGLGNVSVIPNFKNLTCVEKDKLVYPEGQPYKLCTFSRVMKEKGIEDAVNAVRSVNDEYGKTVLSLDIYGQVQEGQEQWFEELQKNFPDYITHKGCAEVNKSTEILKDYFALLFPTFYDGEGLAGTLIDAFFAGVPVIASDWRYNSEIATNDVGLLYEAKNNDELIRLLKEVVINPDMILSKKENCIDKACSYTAEAVMKKIVCELNKG